MTNHRRSVAAIALLVAGTLLTTLPARAASTTVSEFYHAGFGHYFMTSFSGEAAILDNGTTIAGWLRTATEIVVDDAPAPGLVAVCRFFSNAFDPKSSHFYTAFGPECEAVKRNPDWTFEAEAFYVPLPDGQGRCAVGTTPIYRLYNQGQGGAPNHKFTPYESERLEFIALGWVPEGLGANGVVFCAHSFQASAQAKTTALAGRTLEFRYTRGQTPWTIRVTFGALRTTSDPEFPYEVSFGSNAANFTFAGWEPYAGKYLGVARSGGLVHIFLFDFASDGVTLQGCAAQVPQQTSIIGPCYPLSGSLQ